MPKLILELRPSTLGCALYICLALGACWWIWMVDLPWLIKILCTLGNFYYLKICLLKITGKAHNAIVRCQELTGITWLLYTERGKCFEGILEGDSFCMPFLIILNFKAREVLTPDARRFSSKKMFKQQKISIILFKDSLTSAQFRKLSLRLFIYKKLLTFQKAQGMTGKYSG